MSKFKAKFKEDIATGIASALGEGVAAADVTVHLHKDGGVAKVENHYPQKLLISLHKKMDQTNATATQTAYQAVVEQEDGMLVASIEVIMENDWIVEDDLDGI